MTVRGRAGDVTKRTRNHRVIAAASCPVTAPGTVPASPRRAIVSAMQKSLATSSVDSAHSVDPLVDDLAEWLMSQALGDVDVNSIFAGTCERLLAAAIPVKRAMVSFRTLHPLFGSVSMVWRRGERISRSEHLHGEAFTSAQWQASPMFYILDSGIGFVRRRLDGPERLIDFPVLEDLAQQGFSDYLAYGVAFSNPSADDNVQNGILGSWTTDRAGGFSAQNVGALMRIQRRLAVAFKSQIQAQVTRNVLQTYLGHDAGEKVLRGEIRRGDGSEVHAVIFMSDLRDSTGYADILPGEDFLRLLNRYFDCTAGAVLDAGGEVLRFVGDSVLAIFPSDAGRSTEAARRAMQATASAQERLTEFNAERARAGLKPIDFGIGLHVGNVMFGNIGVPERLEFSVVGPAANEVARLETLTKSLARRVLASAEFAALVDADWEPCGSFELRGVGSPIDVFAVGQPCRQAVALARPA